MHQDVILKMIHDIGSETQSTSDDASLRVLLRQAKEKLGVEIVECACGDLCMWIARRAVGATRDPWELRAHSARAAVLRDIIVSSQVLSTVFHLGDGLLDIKSHVPRSVCETLERIVRENYRPHIIE